MKPFPISWQIPLLLLLTIVAPISISTLILYNQPKDFDPIPISGYPSDESIQAAYKSNRIAGLSERIGDGLLPGPEDLAYDVESGFVYTGCVDGWIRRVGVPKDGDVREPVVEDWVRVGGRPLGVALGLGGSLVVAEADTGLLLISPNKEVHLLTNEAEGVKFRLTDGVDVATNGMIYFTDASHKYDLHAHMLDILEGRPNGRLMSFDPSTNRTVALVRDLYFANGVALSPDQRSLIFCETTLRRCRRYHIHGEKKGEVETFVDNLPGFPDNIRYDGEGHYWIGLAAGRSRSWDVLLKHPLLRRMMVAVGKLAPMSVLQRDSGVLGVNLEGRALALFCDPSFYAVTGGLKIGKHLYYGSLVKPYISRIDLSHHPDLA